MPPRRVYWDACVFLGLLNQEPYKANACTAVWQEAERGETLIVTSFLTFAEVFRARCEGPARPLRVEDERSVDQLLGQRWIRAALVDERVAVAARRLMRAHAECKKPSDGIHLATAALMNVEEMHTYDHSDLLKLDGRTLRSDGKPLKIALPTPLPLPPAPPKLLPPPGLFDELGGPS